MDSTITIQYYDDDDEGRTFQCFNLPHLPRKGDKLSIWLSRDRDGNYDLNGKQKEIMNGIVVKVDHSIRQSGNSSRTYKIAQYINIYLEEKEQ